MSTQMKTRKSKRRTGWKAQSWLVWALVAFLFVLCVPLVCDDDNDDDNDKDGNGTIISRIIWSAVAALTLYFSYLVVAVLYLVRKLCQQALATLRPSQSHQSHLEQQELLKAADTIRAHVAERKEPQEESIQTANQDLSRENGRLAEDLRRAVQHAADMGTECLLDSALDVHKLENTSQGSHNPHKAQDTQEQRETIENQHLRLRQENTRLKKDLKETLDLMADMERRLLFPALSFHELNKSPHDTEDVKIEDSVQGAQEAHDPQDHEDDEDGEDAHETRPMISTETDLASENQYLTRENKYLAEELSEAMELIAEMETSLVLPALDFHKLGSRPQDGAAAEEAKKYEEVEETKEAKEAQKAKKAEQAAPQEELPTTQKKLEPPLSTTHCRNSGPSSVSEPSQDSELHSTRSASATTDTDQIDPQAEASVFTPAQRAAPVPLISAEHSYANAAFQCLLACVPFVSFWCTRSHELLHGAHVDRLTAKEQDFLRAFGAAMTASLEARNDSGPVNILPLVEASRAMNPAFNDYRQQDAHEFLSFLLHTLRHVVGPLQLNNSPANQEQTKGKEQGNGIGNSNSNGDGNGDGNGNANIANAITSLFFGQQQVKLTCTSCGYHSEKLELFLHISLPVVAEEPAKGIMKVFAPLIKMKSRLSDCFAAWASQEECTPPIRCQRCNRDKAFTKALSIFRFPRIMMVQLQRFPFKSMSWNCLKYQKRHTFVKIPSCIDLGDMASSADTDGHPHPHPHPVLYRHVAQCDHIGDTIEDGHYTAAVSIRNRDQQGKGKDKVDYFRCIDRHVSPMQNAPQPKWFSGSKISKSKKQMCAGVPVELSGSTPQVLFYERVCA